MSLEEKVACKMIGQFSIKVLGGGTCLVKELITVEFSQDVTGRKSSLQNDWLIFHKGVRGQYLFV